MRLTDFLAHPIDDGDSPRLSARCPICRGHAHQMGVLGTLDHYRCSRCGIDFTAPQSGAVSSAYSEVDDGLS